ncbi:MAG TPA: N-acetylmuramoyl-L-alanine amidase [Nannocystis sp.]|jgi:N-acetyl-anhydromuramyl-L-alanine amidase AmpD
MLRRLSISFLAAIPLIPLVLSGCEGGGRDPGESAGEDGEFPVPDPVDPAAPADPGEYLMGIEGEFMAASEEFNVPVDVLKAVGYVESQWQMVAGEVEFEGIMPAFGAMALRGPNLARGATLLGVEEDAVKQTRQLNIRAAAAVLSEKADIKGIDRANLGAWAPAIAELSGIEPESAAAMSYIHQNVYSLISNGLVVTDLAGNVISEIKPKTGVLPDYPDPNGPVLAANPDFAGATFRASPNFSARPAGTTGQIRIVIIHTCEGAYAGCWGWLAQSKSGVSAHYVVKEDGSEITQLVKEKDKAWHIAAKYKKSLNGGMFGEVEGSSGNNFTVGIEHAGFGSQKSWNPNLIDQSAKLVCDITRRQGIPRDKYHIVGHGQLQPYNRTDPGPNWPWATYFNKIIAACGEAPQDDPPPPPPPEPPPPHEDDPPPPPPPDDSTTSGGDEGGSTTDPYPDDPPPDDPPPDVPPPADASEIIIDNDNSNNASNADYFAPAAWTATASTPGFYGNNYTYAATTTEDNGAEHWFYLETGGTYNVDVWYTAGANRAASAAIVAFDAANTEIGYQTINMQQGGKAWTPAGTYTFTAGWNMVMVSRWADAGFVVVSDAVRVRP